MDISLRYRFLVVVAIAGIIGFGSYAYTQLPIDAFPDISPVMVPVFADAHGMAPEEIERLIAFPIESAMNGLPGVTQIKSTSAFGLVAVYVYFEDDVDIYFARTIVAERLNRALAELPPMHEPPQLGPISTGLGQIFIYYLTLDEGADTEGKASDIYLREVNDWVVKRQLQTVPGVTDILSIGGHVLQYQIQVNPHALNRHHVSLSDLVRAVKANNASVGGQFMVLGQEEHLVRGIGLLRDLEDIGSVPIAVRNGVPIRVADVADVCYGPEVRRGVVSRNGTAEVVSGMVLQLYGENTSKVIERLHAKIIDVQASLLPACVSCRITNRPNSSARRPDRQRGPAVGRRDGGRDALCLPGQCTQRADRVIVASACALISVILMRLTGISANLMSLGGIAIGIGMLADGAIVMVENIFRHLNLDVKDTAREKAQIVFDAASQVSRPIVFSILIIVTVFLPIFALQDVEGKMFAPMAATLCFALAGSLIVAVAVAPALCTYFLKERRHREFALVNWLTLLYHRPLRWAIRHRAVVLAAVLVAFFASLLAVPHLGTEFIPTLEEGSILIGVTMAPSISLAKATETVQLLERKIVRFEEVEEVVSRVGRPESGSHPHPVNYAEVHIALRPANRWTQFANKKELVAALNETLSAYPGVQLNFTQPIQNAFDELLSGIKAQVAIKLFGEDLDVLRDKAGEIAEAIAGVPGLVDLAAEQNFGQPQVQVIADRAACSRYGIDVSDILELVELAIGGEVIDTIYLQSRRFGIHVRYQEPYRADPEAIEGLLVPAQNGMLIPLKQVARVDQVTGPIQIHREHNQRRWVVQANIRGRDTGSVIADVQEAIARKVTLPPGYHIEYGGQFENQQRAMTRLSIIVPIVIAAVVLMLFLAFGSLRHAMLIVSGIPLALIGGVFGLLGMGEYLSVPAAVGFIALFGIAVQNGVVLVTRINQMRDEGMTVDEAVIAGSLQRLRPVLMTATTTVLGLLPLLLSHGIGSEVQRPLATVVVFGLTSATFLTLFVIPALYSWFSRGTVEY
jgi:cobalt-zinc-cadmium resistance protein CzcA